MYTVSKYYHSHEIEHYYYSTGSFRPHPNLPTWSLFASSNMISVTRILPLFEIFIEMEPYSM